MKYDPVKYKHYERDPIGCFSAEMTANGWVNTKFDHDLQEHLLSDEVSEFVRLVYHIFKECADWKLLEAYAKKHGGKEKNDGFSTIYVVCYEGDMMDYAMNVNVNKVTVFPYRKYTHKRS